MKKKFILGLWTLLLCICLAGCGSDQESADQSQTESSREEEEQTSSRIHLNELAVSDYVTLGEYKGIAVTVTSVETGLEDLVWQEYYMQTTLENGGVTDRAVENGDIVNIDYVGKKDDVAFDGGTASGVFLAIGSHTYIDGFEEGLVGATPGETVDLNLTFPENYGNAELAGAKVIFTVTVNFIVAEMTDDVVAGFGTEDYANVEQLRQYVHDNHYEEVQYDHDSSLENAVLQIVVDNCSYSEFPEDLLQQYRQDASDSIEATASMYGLDGETFANYFYGMSLADTAAIIAEMSVEQALAYQAIAEAEGLGISDEMLQTRLEQYAEEVGAEGVEDLLAGADREEYREFFMLQDVMDFLIENAAVTEL